MEYFKKIDLPIYENLDDELRKLKLSWSQNQICLNAPKDDINNYKRGCGSLQYDWENAKTITDEMGKEILHVPEHSVKLDETDFTELCTVFYGTVFEEIYNLLKLRYNIGRVRFMKSKPKTCLSWHVDNTSRLHYPITTQEGCFMVINDEVKHLSENTWWWTETTHQHTAFNASKKERIHLVVTLLD